MYLSCGYLVIVCLAVLLGPSFGEIYEECEGVDDGVFVSSSSSCSSYILCSGDDSMIGECEDDQYFDGESGTCDDQENVYCALDEEDEDGEEDEEEEEEEEEEDETTTTIAPTTTTTASSIGNSTMDPDGGLHIDTEVREICPPLDDINLIVVLPKKDSCTDYFLCYHGNPIDMHCTNHLHFNPKTGKCDFPENVQCQAIRPTASKCLPHMTDFFPHPDKCNYFYYCVKGYLTIQQCPFYYGWDVEKRSCVLMSQAKCFQGAKRGSSKWSIF